MENRKTIANIGDLFVFAESKMIGYISNIRWNKNESANFYTISVIYHDKERSLREFEYHQKSIQGFIMHSPSMKYYAIK